MSAITVTGDDGAFGAVAAAASEYFSLAGNAEIETVFASEEEIRALNAQTRGVDKVTDVLSFPALTLTAGAYAPFSPQSYPFECDPESGKVHLGSIVICLPTAQKQAEEYGHTVEREKAYLFLHGVLHLLGFDHIEDADRAAMRKAEEEILGKLGLKREE